MSKKPFRNIRLSIVVLSLGLFACGVISAPAPTSVPTKSSTSTPIPLPTQTTTPTVTPYPTATPNIADTQQAASNQATIQKYVDAGYLTSANGTFIPLTTSTFNMAQKDYFNFVDSGTNQLVTDFAVWADFKWESAGPVNYPEYSGCGFVFRYQQSGDGYTAMLTNDSILLTACQAAKGNSCDRVGKTKGSGRVSISEPYQAHFEFIVSNGLAYALVNGTFVGEYTLFQDKIVNPGNIYYAMISGTNKDYGTRCTIDNATLWVPGS